MQTIVFYCALGTKREARDPRDHIYPIIMHKAEKNTCPNSLNTGLWPGTQSFDGKVVTNWRRLAQEYDILVAAAQSGKSKNWHAYILLNLAGCEAIEKERSFSYDDKGRNREDPECQKTKFAEICIPRTNITMERHKFNTTI